MSKKGKNVTKQLTFCALLTAMSIILARLIIPMPNESTRFSIEAVPIFLAGMLFGPIPGALVGFAEDFIGCLFSPFGYNPIFCIPPILYGLCGGLLHLALKPQRVDWVQKGFSKPIPIHKRRIWVNILLSIVTLGIYQIYWMYLLVKNTRAIQEDESSCTGEMLCLILVPFYSLFWWFTKGKIVKDKFAEHGYSATGSEIAYLILGIFCLPIVSMAIMQNDFNTLTTHSVQQKAKKVALWRIALAFLPAIVLGSILIQSCTLAYMYGGDAKEAYFYVKLTERSIQFAVTYVLDVAIVYLLAKSPVFAKVGLR